MEVGDLLVRAKLELGVSLQLVLRASLCSLGCRARVSQGRHPVTGVEQSHLLSEQVAHSERQDYRFASVLEPREAAPSCRTAAQQQAREKACMHGSLK